MHDMVAWALRYAEMGWPVFPIVKGEKRPATKNGYKDATTDPDKIRAWWTRYPDRNIGVSTSAKAGICVLDSDDGGEDTLARLGMELPATIMARTPSGGIHRIFKLPEGVEIPRRIRFAIGLDMLGERDGAGGYFVAAPSVRDDGSYEWINSPDDAIACEIPSDLVEMVLDTEADRPRPDHDPVQPVRSAATTNWGRAALTGEAERVRTCPPGSQNTTLYERAIRIGSIAYGGSIDEREAFETMVSAGMSMANQQGKPKWTRPEVEKLVRRAFTYGAQDPTPPPARNNTTPAHDPETGEVIEDDAIPVDDDGPPEPPPPDGSMEDYFLGRDEDEPNEKPVDEKPVAKKRTRPFRILGHNRGSYFYLPDGSMQVVELRAHEHTALRLMGVADLTYWMKSVNAREKIKDEHWQAIANGLMRACEDNGIFDESRLRGRGAWIEGKSVVVHTGTDALVDGHTTPLGDISTKNIYEAGTSWEFGHGHPCTSKQAHRLVQICERLTWVNPLSGALLAGFCVIATVSGALVWRPHIWISGPSGSGKTTAVNDVVGRTVGPASERFDGKTTEAGIRQRLGKNAQPVIIDEAENEDQAAVTRMQGILDLARVASSGGTITKGSASHRAVSFTARSCFCFSSIHTSMRHTADESRVSRLVLRPNNAEDKDAHYEALMRDIYEWFTPEFASGLFTRTTDNLTTLLRNAEIFTQVAAIEFKSRRAADQLGALLAGYYLCHSTNEITVAKAKDFIRKHDWGEHLSLDGATDEERLFTYLMSRQIRVADRNGQREMSIGQAIESAHREIGDAAKPYFDALGPRGIKVSEGYIVIANRADGLSEMLRNEPQWQSDWKRPLSMLPGAEKSVGAVYFAPGVIARGIELPVGLLDGSYVERVPGEDG